MPAGWTVVIVFFRLRSRFTQRLVTSRTKTGFRNAVDDVSQDSRLPEPAQNQPEQTASAAG